MIEVSTELIKQAVYNLCFEANTCLEQKIYSKIEAAYKNAIQVEEKNILKTILQNAKIAYEKKLPLCQDTGQVIVFVQIGQNVLLTGEYLENAINSAIEKCYIEKFFRKSVVKNAIFDRTNTKNNIPAIIHSKIVQGSDVKISVLIKGAGSENKSRLEMMLPTSSKTEIIDKCVELILSAGENSCPPMFIGIGIGGTADKAMLLSKEALIYDDFSDDEFSFAENIKNSINSKAKTKFGNSYVLDIKVKTTSTHIACLPVAITFNCHSERTSSCIIQGEHITYLHQIPNFKNYDIKNETKTVFSGDIDTIKNLQIGEEINLSGEIYVARDMAHKRLQMFLDEGKDLPIEIKNKIIFYAGPCPNKPNEIIGSIGPTTAGRMDKYAITLYNKGLLATIGKGDRSTLVQECIEKNNARYFEILGGVAAFLADKVENSEIVAFEDLGAEAIFKIEVKNFPLKVIF